MQHTGNKGNCLIDKVTKTRDEVCRDILVKLLCYTAVTLTKPWISLAFNLFTAWEDAIWRPCMILHSCGTERVNHKRFSEFYPEVSRPILTHSPYL